MRRGKRFGEMLLLCSLAMIVACGESDPTGSDDDELGHPTADMVATWTYASVTLNGSTISLAAALDWVTGAVASKIHVSANGSYYYEEVNGSGAQLWVETGWIFVDPEGPTIEFHILSDDDGNSPYEYTVSYDLAGSTMTVTLVDGGDTYVFTLTK